MPEPPKFRVPQGALLRSGLEAIQRQAMPVPPGKKGRVGVAVEHEDGTLSAEIGAAWLTSRGWQVDASVGVALARGQRPRVSGAGQLTW